MRPGVRVEGESRTSTLGRGTPTNWIQRGSRTDPRLSARAAGGGDRYVDRDDWLWPLPPAGLLRVAFQWLEQGIAMSTQDLETDPFLEAATRAQPVWPRN